MGAGDMGGWSLPPLTCALHFRDSVTLVPVTSRSWHRSPRLRRSAKEQSISHQGEAIEGVSGENSFRTASGAGTRLRGGSAARKS